MDCTIPSSHLRIWTGFPITKKFWPIGAADSPLFFSRRRFRKRWSLRSSSSETMVSPDAGRRQRRSVSLVVMVVMMKSWDLSDLTWFDQEKLGLEYLWMIDGSLFLLPFGSQRWLGSPLWIYSFRARKIIKEQGGSSIAMFEKSKGRKDQRSTFVAVNIILSHNIYIIYIYYSILYSIFYIIIYILGILLFIYQSVDLSIDLCNYLSPSIKLN